MTANIILRCETEDPVDVLSRVLLMVARCSIGLEGARMCRDGGAMFVIEMDLADPLPMTQEQLLDRVQGIPAIDSARYSVQTALGLESDTSLDTGSGDQSAYRWALST